MDLSRITNEGAARLRKNLEKQEQPEEEKPEEKPEEKEEEKPLEDAQESEVKEEETTEEETKKDDSISGRERALLKEITRLKADRRVDSVKIELDEIAPTIEEAAEETEEVTPAEARLFTAWRNEALEELVEKHPQYKTDPKLWERFAQEYSERVPELVWAKRNKVSVGKSLFRERLQRVHRALQDNTDNAREEGKKELLKAQSAADVMGAGAAKGSQPSPEKPAPKKHFIPRNAGGFDSWLTKK